MYDPPKVNDFSITFATVNGSGSLTANHAISRAIFKMGIPVSARNVFPSNIQGMPTWYSLRVSKNGYLGSVECDDILVAMNPESFKQDVERLKPGGMLLYNQAILAGQISKEIIKHSMPVDDIVKSCEFPTHLNVYLANMVYVGILAYLIGIELEKLETALDYHFSGKRSAIEPNMAVIQASYAWAVENISEKPIFQLKAMKPDDSKIMIDGNTAAALGALYGGLQFAAWYPITPATSLAESLNEYIPLLRTDSETGNISCVVVQAEDELAAIGMAVGAGWAGMRAMTSTSGPGLCLMAEFLGLAYFTEVPLVVWNVQRAGPSTGMPTHTSQADLAFSYFISHGDKDFIILLPATSNECFEFGWRALDIAEQLQTPVIVLSDLELGMNIWITDRLEYPGTTLKRGKVLWEKDLEDFEAKYQKPWARYIDVDGDGIPYRTLPGNMNPKAPYFTRGTSHDEFAHYSESPEEWERNLLRLRKKFEKAKTLVPHPQIMSSNNADAIISYGSSNFAMHEVLEKMKANERVFDYMRIRAIPFTNQVDNFIKKHKKIFVVENNRDGQMKQILSVNYPEQGEKFISISRANGLPLSSEWICSQIKNQILRDEKSG